MAPKRKGNPEAVDAALLKEFFTNTDAGDPSPYTAALGFVEDHLVQLSVEQTQALTRLALFGPHYKRVVDAVLEYRPLIGEVGPILQAIEAISFDRKFSGVQGIMTKGK